MVVVSAVPSGLGNNQVVFTTTTGQHQQLSLSSSQGIPVSIMSIGDLQGHHQGELSTVTVDLPPGVATAEDQVR